MDTHVKTKIEATINGNRAFYTAVEILVDDNNFLKFKDIRGELVSINKKHIDRMWQSDRGGF
jgi:hypothetical protein